MRFRKLTYALFLILTIAALMAPATRAEEGVPEKLSLSFSNGAVSASVGGRVIIEGLYPEVNLPAASLTPAGGGLTANTQDQSEGSDGAGRYTQLVVDYSNASGSKIVSMRVRTRETSGALILTADLLYAARLPLRPESSFKLKATLPGLTRAQGTERFSQFWTRPFFATSTNTVPDETQFLLWEDHAGLYGAMIPLVGGGMRGAMNARNGFGVAMSSYDFQFKPAETIPVLAVAVSKDPYSAVRETYRAGMDDMGRPGRLRTEKAYPDVFEYIGWCSWNAYYSTVSRDAIIAAARSFKKIKFPLGFLIIDDGWQSETGRMLTSFEANPKFPGGLAPLVRTLKNSYGIRWVGVWHAFQGYWDGVNENSELGKKYKNNLFKTFVGKLIPDPRSDAGYKFYFDYHNALRREGIDLVKVDNQSTMSVHTNNLVPIAGAMQQQQLNLQGSVNMNFSDRIINCMDMTIENVYFWLTSNVSRSSDDFMPGRADNARVHVLHNVYNSLWMSQLAYPDFDMFQSHHPQAVVHAVLRAISGGPVYVTDTPGQQNPDILWKLVYPDGRLLRADQPAMPSPDSLFTDPTVNPVPLKAFTLAGGAGVVAAFNVKMDGGKVEGSVSTADVPGLAASERYAIYEHFSQKLTTVGPGENITVELPEFGVALYTIVPLKAGFAPIGLADKYLSPRAVLRTEIGDGEFTVDLAAPGKFVAWLERKPYSVTLNGERIPATAYTWKDRTFTIDIPAETPAPAVVKIKY